MHIKCQAMSIHLSGPGSWFATWGGQMIKHDLKGSFPHKPPWFSIVTQSSGHHCREMAYRNSQPCSPALLACQGLGAWAHQCFFPSRYTVDIGLAAFGGKASHGSVCVLLGSPFLRWVQQPVRSPEVLFIHSTFLMSLPCCDHFPMWSFKEDKLDCKSQ